MAGVMSGLTMGLMSLALTTLRVVAKTGEPSARRHAQTIIPLEPSVQPADADPDREVDPGSFRDAAAFAVQKRPGWQTFPLEAQSRYVRLVVRQNHAFASTAGGAHASVRINEIEVLEA